MAKLKGVTPEQQGELNEMLERLGTLWAELTQAAQAEDQEKVARIQNEIAACRNRVEQIKRSGTLGSA